MPRWILIALIAFSVVSGARAQTTPVPTPPDDVVKITTSLIQLDVSVTDKKGRVITDLRPDEFEVYENGKRQKLSGFSFVSAVREVEVAAPAGKQEDRPVLPGKIKPGQVLRLP